MKKSTWITLSLLLVLVAVSVMVYKNKTKTSTIDEEASNFKVKDTASVDKIFLADKNNKSVTVTRTAKGWMVNDKYPARPDVIKEILETIRLMEVKSPVPKVTRESVIKRMATQSIKVEIYSKGEKIKQFYVGYATMDYTGTYMVLTNLEEDKNYDEPFVVQIPGFEGYLTTRFLTDADDWRDRLVINYTPPEMKQIKLDLYEMPDSSFTIDIANSTTFSLKNTKGLALPYDEMKMKQYLAYFQNVNYEKLITNIKDKVVDSLSTAIPFATLTVTDKNNQIHTLQFIHKYALKEQVEQYGANMKYDPDRLYLRFNQNKELAVIQFYVFGKILQTYGYFLPQNPVKK